MCGIAGWIDWKGEVQLDKAHLKAMAGSLTHRGPDEEGLRFSPPVAFCHKRLTIIAPQGGHQPMQDPSGLLLTFNGEIYNYQELRAQLLDLGEAVLDDSDTAVLLAAYRHWGPDCLPRLVGMFALAIWDPNRGELFVARDRLGKKPLYYHHQGGFFAFGSELKALLQLPNVVAGAEPNLKALSDFLSLGYILAPKTIFSNLLTLPPATYGLFRPRTGQLELTRYWNPAAQVMGPRIRSLTQAKEELLALLDQAVTLRLRSDVPLGGFLSGGVDSSSIFALIRRHQEASFKGYTIGFEDKSYDESPYVRNLARFFNAQVTFKTYQEPRPDELSRMAWHFDQPFCDTSLIATYQLNRLAGEQVRVALSGDGADEIFAGYPTYQADRYYQAFRHVPGWAQRGMLAGAQKVLRPSYKKLSFDYKALQFLGSQGLEPERAHYWWRVIFSEREKRAIFSEPVNRALEGYDPYQSFQGFFDQVPEGSFLDRCLYVDLMTWLPDDILTKADRMSMAHSVEVRSPFLDHRLVEFCLRLPEGAKQKGTRQKVLLKEVMSPLLPPEVLGRPKKGFGVPHHPRRKLEAPAQDYFNPNFRLDPTREDVTYKAFGLSMLHLWFDLFANLKRTGTWSPIAYEP